MEKRLLIIALILAACSENPTSNNSETEFSELNYKSYIDKDLDFVLLSEILDNHDKLKFFEQVKYSHGAEYRTYTDKNSFDSVESSSSYFIHLNKISKAAWNVDLQFGDKSETFFLENLREIEQNETLLRVEYSDRCQCEESYYGTEHNENFSIAHLSYLNHHNDSSYHIIVHYDDLN